MSKDLILGIDTSNYTTSAALVAQTGELVTQNRARLEVEKGNRGLRQSKAVFQHVEKLPEIINEVIAGHQEQIVKIVVSSRPRNEADSYMPVFRVGEGQAATLAQALNASLEKVSHQAGHLMAGLWSNEIYHSERFLALHLSGGTSELLLVNEKENASFEIEKIGGSQDLTAGQFIDRVGVKLGLSFPAGPELEKLAQQGSEDTVDIPHSVQGLEVSFSGPCSAAMREIEAGKNKADIALGVQQSIAHSLIEVLSKAVKEYDCQDVLLVGGVMANQYLRDKLKADLEEKNSDTQLYFADPRWSSDNAVGTAAIGLKFDN
ncbi:Kae1-like domain-containing protein [Halanaerobacter jeridensis]|uniref:N(6)-L-threonylcarbamoyladenine synthase n=1 Tax=Halanaerobacter jeridensis TaxID=706427 RepID=A0A938XQ48_9FIRM|nr:O-sialoglycoprotein endopeptidase [Halanaerobacter jeridensis]MBM7555235.1 N6-L-threonylcarbamoyladenine synthase [Halanaerobacter jeridensis]